MLRFRIFILIFSAFYELSRCSKPAGLYTPPCDVFTLNINNFTTVIKASESAFFVKFYSAWCGHCINFAPTWKQLASDTKGWRPAIKIGAIDCSTLANMPVCRLQNIEGYPSIKFFLPKPKVDDDGVVIGKHYENQERDIETLKRSMVEYLENATSKWKSFDPKRLAPFSSSSTKSLHKDCIERGLDPEIITIVKVYEDRKSLLGRELILDTCAYSNQVMVYRFVVKPDQLKAMKLETLPTIRIYSKGSTTAFQLPSLHSNLLRHACRYVINKKYGIPIGYKVENADQVNHLDKTMHQAKETEKQEEFHKKMRLSHHAHMQDLDSGLWYSFNYEIAGKKVIDGDKFMALKDYVTVLSKYYPGRLETKAYLKSLLTEITTVWQTSVTGEKFSAFLKECQDKDEFIPHSKPLRYTACRGSKANLRGYTCSLWQLFHTLTVNWFLEMKRAGQEHNTDKKLEILDVMKGYVSDFFTCKECVINFKKKHIPAMQLVKDVEGAVLFLWDAHNKVNKRLAKDIKTNDPLHPKLHFPPQELCTECRKSDAKAAEVIWDNQKVLQFLVTFYAKDNIVQDNEQKTWSRVKKVENLSENSKINPKFNVLKSKKVQKSLLDREKRLSEKEVDGKNEKMALLKLRELNTRHHEGRTRSFLNSWGLSNIDISMCVVFYIVCSCIILMLYFHFTVRRKFRCKYCQV
ncbi:sulfhydryl oxidase 2-like [Lineus longissimus]|uniref:sulfhydryl oxidase 2-like n=1 Tax=Lineus longissimus TaxID=88925 RepID=UPI00315D4983